MESFMTESDAGATGDFAADLAALRKDVAHLAATTRELVQHQTDAASHRISEAAGDVKDRVSSAATGAQRRVCAAGGEVEAYIERNSVTAVLIALGVGISLGLLSRPRG
jgi:ElaB/YqjD/DUF883 family membrane-anchored ribosome-binding protein